MKHKFGDVLKDKNDGEIVMVIADANEGGDWEVVILVQSPSSHLMPKVTWRDLSTGLWEPIDE